MLTKPLLVPSIDALRLLRRLAFASSALAAVGVVTLNCEVYRRIRLAEQCLETKRQIRALSNGKEEASLALLFEAAENGQDFSHRAMRERRMEEKALQRSISASAGAHGARGQEPMSPATPRREERRHHSREQTAHEIRNATMTMVSTAPTHVYGRPRRHTKPTRQWPEIESREKTPTGTFAPSARKDTLYGDEAAERIKRATMAMTSTAPAHIYGRPPKAVPKAQPNMHDAVATWLDTASDANTLTHVLPASTLDRMDSKPSGLANSRSLETVENVADEVVAYLGTNPTEPEARPGILTLAENLSVTLPNQDVERKYIREASQNTSNPKAKSATPNSPNETTHMTPHNRDIPSLLPSEATQAAFQTELAQDTGEVEASFTNTTSMLDEAANDNLGRHRSPKSLAEHPLPDPKHDELAISVKNDRSDQASSSSNESLFAKSSDCDNAGKSLHESINSSTRLNRAPPEATKGHEQVFQRHQHHDILLQQSPTTNETHSPNFMSWQYLKSLAEWPSSAEEENHPSDGDVTEELQQVSLEDEDAESVHLNIEQQRLPQEDADAETQQINGEPEELRQLWTPFSGSSPAPEDTDAELEDFGNEQRRVPREVIEAGSKQINSEQEESKQWWTPYPRRGLDRDLMPAPLDQHEDSNHSENTVGAPKESPIRTPIIEGDMAALVLKIQNAFSLHGYTAGSTVWSEAAEWSIQRNDFATVDFLYAEFVDKGVLSLSPRYHVVRSLIQWHYEMFKYSERAAGILFPDRLPGRTTSAESDHGRCGSQFSLGERYRVDSLFAVRFLQSLGGWNANSSSLLLHFRRVLAAAKFRGVKPAEELFAVVIRLLASIGDMATAHALYDEMTFYHRIEPSFLTRTLIIRGYARICDWQRVEREVESLHLSGVSRTRPHGYALMINAVLKEYAARASVEQFQNFLVTGISFWGLMPTSHISITAIQAYLSRQRYDLVKEWMETLQILFPQIETETRLFQWVLGNSWQRTGATCQQIEESIKAVAYRNPYTKMKSQSLATIHEALSRDLAAKIDAAQAKMRESSQESQTSRNEGTELSGTKTIDDYLSAAYSLAASTLSQNQEPTPEIIELHRQATAVQRVTTFLASSPSSEAADNFTFPEPVSDTTDTNVNMNMGPVAATFNLSHLQDTIPKVLTSEFLPETGTIITGIIKFYRTRSLQRLPTDHTLLVWVCEKLADAERAFDAVHVLEKVTKHPVVRRLAGLGSEDYPMPDVGDLPCGGAVGFGMQFYEFWMYLASVTKSYVQWKRVASEVLRLSRPSRMALACRDDGSEKAFTGLRVTSSFVFLTQTLAMRGVQGWVWRWSTDYSRRSIEDVNKTIEELERRLKQQNGKLQIKPWSRLRQSGPRGRWGKYAHQGFEDELG
jgi:hypothetical protein